MNPIRPLADIVRSRDVPKAAPGDEGRSIMVRSLSAYYGAFQALDSITLDIRPGLITAIIGPSGCGKSTLIRCINRMHEVVKGAYAEGTVLVDGEDIYASGSSA